MLLTFSMLIIILNAAPIVVNSNFTVIENQLRIKSDINDAKQFCFNDTNLEENSYYQVRTQYLGTKGMKVLLFWKEDESEMREFVSNYQPLDSFGLTFFQEMHQNKQRCFYAIAFQIAKSIHKIPYPDGVEYYLQISKKISEDGDLKELYAYIFVIGGAAVITLLIYLFQRKQNNNQQNIGNQYYHKKLD